MAAIHGSLIPGNRGEKVLVVQNFHEEDHTHPQDEAMVSRAQFQQDVVAQVRQDPKVPVRRVYKNYRICATSSDSPRRR